MVCSSNDRTSATLSIATRSGTLSGGSVRLIPACPPALRPASIASRCSGSWNTQKSPSPTAYARHAEPSIRLAWQSFITHTESQKTARLHASRLEFIKRGFVLRAAERDHVPAKSRLRPGVRLCQVRTCATRLAVKHRLDPAQSFFERFHLRERGRPGEENRYRPRSAAQLSIASGRPSLSDKTHPSQTNVGTSTRAHCRVRRRRPSVRVM